MSYSRMSSSIKTRQDRRATKSLLQPRSIILRQMSYGYLLANTRIGNKYGIGWTETHNIDSPAFPADVLKSREKIGLGS